MKEGGKTREAIEKNMVNQTISQNLIPLVILDTWFYFS